MSRTTTSRSTEGQSSMLPSFKIYVMEQCTAGHSSTPFISSITIVEYDVADPGTSPLRFTTGEISSPYSKKKQSASAKNFSDAWTQLHNFFNETCPPKATPLLVSHDVQLDLYNLRVQLNRLNLPLPSWRFASSQTVLCSLDPELNDVAFAPLSSVARKIGTRKELEGSNGDNVLMLRGILQYIEDKLRRKSGLSMRELLWRNTIPNDQLKWKSIEKKSSRSVPHTGSESGVGYYITTTGRYYHSDLHCSYLNGAKKTIPTSEPSSKLAPCPKCVGKKDENVKDGVGTSKNEGGRKELRSQVGKGKDITGRKSRSRSNSAQELVVTTHGKYYHADEKCIWLKFATTKDRVKTVDKSLKPCPRCAVAGGTVDRNGKKGEEEESKVEAVTEEEVLKMYNSTLYKTPHGTKFHVDRGCKYVRNREVEEWFGMSEDREVCRGCAKKLVQDWNAGTKSITA